MNFSLMQKLNIVLIAIVAMVIFVPNFSHAAFGKLVIDEFMIAGSDTHDEYIVIANFSPTPVNLDGYSLVKRAASVTNYKLFDFTYDFQLNSNQKIKISHAEYKGVRDFVFSGNTIADNNAIYLLAPDKSVVDLVGWGEATYYETEAVSAPGAGDVYARVDGLDTFNNKADFFLQIPVLALDLNVDKIIISELLPNPDDSEEWFELQNPTNLDVSLANTKICDALGAKHCYYFADDEVLSADSFRIYKQGTTKITMNNTGDWLEFYDTNDNLLTDSGGDYGAADKGVSLSIFGSEYRWTKSVTPTAENIFTDIIELEEEPVIKPKATKSKVVKPTKKTVVSVATDENEELAVESAVKAADTARPDMEVKTETKKAVINNKVLGWGLIGLAILLVLGYTGWYLRDYAKNIYDKIRHRDDSARF